MPFRSRIAVCVSALPSPRLLRLLDPASRAVRGRVVWISTYNPHYAIDGVRAGVSVTRAGRRLRLGTVFVVGRNDWYLAPAGTATAILKVRCGAVQEIGLSSNRFTRDRARHEPSYGRSIERTLLTGDRNENAPVRRDGRPGPGRPRGGGEGAT